MERLKKGEKMKHIKLLRTFKSKQKGQILIEIIISLIGLTTLLLFSVKGIKEAYKLNKKNQHYIYQK